MTTTIKEVTQMNRLPVESFHTILPCRRWDACVSFYRDVLEFEAVDIRPGFIELEVAPGSRLGLLRRAKCDNPESRDDSVILTFRVGDVDKIHNILSARCEEISQVKSHPWGARLFELRDPEGRRLEFWTPQ